MASYTMEGSAYHLAPAEVWKCYARLRADRVKTPEPGEALTNLISLVRFAIGQQAELAPFPELARQKFANWLNQIAIRQMQTLTAPTALRQLEQPKNPKD